MAGSFASFGSALSALRHSQVVADIAAGNIANAGTEGYHRRRVEAASGTMPITPARWSHPAVGQGSGVSVLDVSRMTDPLLDARARREHGRMEQLAVRTETLARLESGIGEPGDHGVSAAMASFRQAWHDLANQPSSDAARNQVISAGVEVAEALATQARRFGEEATDQRTALGEFVAETNALTQELGQLNEAIARDRLSGVSNPDLIDQRDRVAMRLSELTGATTEVRADGGMDVTLGGASLVNGKEVQPLTITAEDPLDLAISGPTGDVPVTAAVGGAIGATVEIITVTIPTYLAGLDATAAQLADDVNAAHRAGYTADGSPAGDFFTYGPAAASSLHVAVTQPGEVGASGVAGGAVDGSNATAVSDSIRGGEAAYRSLVTDFGITVATADRLARNQSVLTDQIDLSRQQIAGVNTDEEVISIAQAQRSFEAASRVITVVDSLLDTLINRTGVLR
ncbi:flagellar hook-associated protein FlgK [Aeromicrobium phragmitis]|uniref:Flagellar hook-associated protein 1 n=1 Tax=Aeromicrobium phragmitis TaxID=2478914 RepID=A0A3L8PM36_9ACTN|nr:flagellar hook-associated protein FlgK [Aeromicrobium phragmitis]RLV56456.1 flagellar hook-associated protein FlgK [Aeromicrobium phragmitis]